MNPSIKRFVKKCEDFYICAEIGEKNAVGVEYADDRLTLYQYIVKGKISFNTIDGNNFTREICESKDGLIDVKKYLNQRLLLTADEDFFMIGFNSINKNVSWDGELKTKSFTGNSNSWLLVLDGKPSINGKSLRRFDYAKLEDKLYDVNLNDGVIGVFTKTCLF